jgi:RHS repeat-associated protein
VTNTWELDRDVLDTKENKVGAVSVSKLDYSVNAIGQRTALSQTGTAFASVRGIAWAYDSYGQVTSADSSIATQDRAYQYDAIGNRKKSADSLTLPVADNYTANALNQYSSLSIPNPQSPISNPIYDLDGNATSYPLPVSPTTNSTLTWDGENRLTSTTVNGTATTQQFDSTGRRISKTTGTTTRLYLYDAWNVIAEYSYSSLPTPTSKLLKTYLWGNDLSGTLQGAGGVGGLLCESNISNPLSPISYPTYDGNGNISEYLTATGSVAAHFEYDPFGNTVINTDPGNQFTYKFSTKTQDIETALYYYGYRYFDPATGRWMNRDPIGEKGGSNIYKILYNNTIDKFDVLGMFEYPPSYPGYDPEPPKPPTETDLANKQFNEMLKKYLMGSSKVTYNFDMSSPWTRQVMKKPVYDRMRGYLKLIVRDYIKSNIPIDFTKNHWDDEAEDGGFLQPLRDLGGYLGDGSLKSLGSADGYFYIYNIDTKNCTFSYNMWVRNSFRFGSMLRIPIKGGIGAPDNPVGDSDSIFNTIYINFFWSETMSVK